jgi:dihydrofolate synthase/folylpolyglutamate synthase
MRDKAIGEIAEIINPLADRVIATHAENPRAASPQQIAELGAHAQTEILQANTVQEALDRACTMSGPKGVIVITGSIYIVGEALGIFARKPVRQGA